MNTLRHWSIIDVGEEHKLKKLENLFSYQDDLISLNDEGLQNSTEMVVNCINISPRKCYYLDLSISIYRGKFRVTLYDERTNAKIIISM